MLLSGKVCIMCILFMSAMCCACVLHLRVTGVLTFVISVDWSNFLPANISYMHYRALEFVDPVPFSCTNRKI